MDVDISPRQIALARVNVPGAEFIEGDAASLDFGEDSFDAVVSFYMLEHIPRAETLACCRASSAGCARLDTFT